MSESSIPDLAIVGAGPAGAAAAITAARHGLRVVLLDRATFPRDKICGDGLTTGALRMLDDLGVDPARIPSWTEVHDIKVSGPLGHTVTFSLPRDRGSFAVVARRADVDPAMVHHYFGTKDELLAAAIDLPMDPRQVTDLVQDGTL